ncbi:transcriptional regulator, LysR family [Agromyces sp. CF514]|uniref:LysR family transcriptional regulator n=1 Tax=Agromyces sp. CF514 TaxID=1881031 RepID=UPI0008E2737F|nr:LysR family transcriptional regulator [Agromyces sp. CF514]SFR83293.1 transcriptional regulator, LysR family [Agromyces sp. CF514]
MELRDIEIFLTLAEELHFGRTAERLHVSVSRVSQAIRAQETEIGAPLFTRTSRRVTLTRVGETLRSGLRPAFDGIEATIAAARAAARDDSQQLTIGLMGAQAHDLAPVLEAFRATHPLAEVRFREVFFADPFGPLRHDEVDLMINWLPVDEPDLSVGCVLREEPLNLIVSTRHPLAGRDSVSLEELGDLVVPAIAAPDTWLAGAMPTETPSGRPIRRGSPVFTFSEVLAVVAEGGVVCPVPDEGRRYFPWPGVTYVPFHDAPPVRWALLRRTARTPRPIARSFIATAEQVRRELADA